MFLFLLLGVEFVMFLKMQYCFCSCGTNIKWVPRLVFLLLADEHQ